MSEHIYKVFPVEEIESDKTELIRKGLEEAGFISGVELKHHHETYLQAGDRFCEYMAVEDNVCIRYKDEIRLRINPDGYGISLNEDDLNFNIINRRNVVEIYNVDDDYLGCDKLCELLKEITGNNYLGEIERA